MWNISTLISSFLTDPQDISTCNPEPGTSFTDISDGSSITSTCFSGISADPLSSSDQISNMLTDPIIISIQPSDILSELKTISGNFSSISTGNPDFPIPYPNISNLTEKVSTRHLIILSNPEPVLSQIKFIFTFCCKVKKITYNTVKELNTANIKDFFSK